MALETLTPPEQDSDRIQSGYNDQFAQITSPENYARNGGQDRKTPTSESLRNQEASGTNKSLFNRDGESGSEGDKSGRAAGLGVAGLGAAEALGHGFNPAGAVGGGMRGLAKTFIGSRRRKQATIGGGVLGLIIGGGFFFLSITSGPLEIIHFAQLMEHIHLTTNDNQGNDRTFKIFRSVKNLRNGQAYRNNLGRLGNTYAGRIEAKLNAAGYKSAYNPRTGAWEGLVIDRTAPEYRGLNDPDIQAAVKEKLGVDLKKGPISGYKSDQLYVDPRGTGYSKGVRNSRGVVKDILVKSGYSNLSSSIQARVMGKRFGLTLHPIRRLDAKLIDAADKAYQKKIADKAATKADAEKAAAEAKRAASLDEQANIIANGDTAVVEAQKLLPEDPNATPEQKAAIAATNNEASKAIAEGQTAGAAPGSEQPGALKNLQTKITDSTSFKVGGVLAAVVGVACILKSIDSSATQINEVQVIEPVMRMAGELLYTAGQIQSGQDLDIDQVGYYADRINDPATKSSFIQAQSIQAENGNPYDKSQVNPALTAIGKNETPFHFLNNGTAGTATDALCGTVGTVVTSIIGIASGPISAVTGFLTSYFAGPVIIQHVAGFLAGKPINVGDVGAALGDDINYGSKLVANASAITTGGSVLTATQVGALKSDESLGYQNQIASESFVKRTFDPKNSTSLVASLIDKFAIMRTNGFASTISSLFSFKNYTGLFGSIFTKHASADTLSESYDYGIPTYGFTKDEMDNQSTSDPFANADAASAILDSSDGQKYIDRARQCFGVNITPDRTATDGHTEWVVLADLTTKTNYYGSDYKQIAGDCADSSSAWLRIRFMIFDTQSMKSIACNEGDTQSCTELGFGPGSAGGTAP
jgi:hypothetical protein